MQDKLLNAVIQLTEEGSTTVGKFGRIKKLKGRDIQTGKVNTYTIYETKQDGSISDAWATYNNGALLGQTVSVGYVSKEGTLQDGTPFTQRIIRTFDLDIGNGVQNSQDQKSNVSEANRGQSEHSGDAFGRRLGVQGHINALLSNPDYYGGQDSPPISELVREAIAIEDEAEKQLNPSKFRQTVQATAPQVLEDEIPTIQIEDDLGADIPF